MMNKKGILAEKTGFYIAFIFLFSFAFLYAANFLGKTVVEFNKENIEDSIIATRVLGCFSGNKLGILEANKFSEDNLNRCFSDDKYSLKINLRNKDGEEMGLFLDREFDDFRSIKRYVKLIYGEGILEIRYRKNLDIK